MSEIQNFYKDCNVFITGGTGFIGKVLVEKLLRSTEVSTIYLLIRNKKGKNLHNRLKEIFEDVLFDRLKAECPEFKQRVIGIPGDCSLSGLDLSNIDRKMLISNISIVIHAAATVRFDENLKLAYAINVSGTHDMLKLCRQMKGLKSIVHISTAYCNCHLNEIDEKFYDYPVSYEDIGNLLQKLSKEDATELTPKIKGKWPNTYTFTKALAESLIRNVGKDLPVGIFRPGIIVSTYKEPVEGWADNLYGATGVCVAANSGLLKVFHGNENVVGDLVPADTCVAGVLACAWDIANTYSSNNKTSNKCPIIYNYVSSVENRITWGEFHMLIETAGKMYPSSKSLFGSNKFTLTENMTLYLFLRFFLHIIPAIVIDFGGIVFGQKPKLLTMYKKIHKFLNALEPFTMKEWHYKNTNTVNLWEKMNNVDRKLFPLSITTVPWLTYFKPFTLGIRLYLLQDSLDTLEYARIRQKRFEVLQNAIYFVVNFLLMVGLWLLMGEFVAIFSNSVIASPYQSLLMNSTYCYFS